MPDPRPRNIEDFVAWQLFKHVAGYLAAIRRTAGYNTDPLVTLDFRKYRDTSVKYRVLLETPSNDPYEESIGGSDSGVAMVYQQLDLRIAGIAKIEGDEIPRLQAMMLEQDVRTALNLAKADASEVLSRGFSFSFGPCSHDAGSLTPDELAGFVLDCSYLYPQGKIW